MKVKCKKIGKTLVATIDGKTYQLPNASAEDVAKVKELVEDITLGKGGKKAQEKLLKIFSPKIGAKKEALKKQISTKKAASKTASKVKASKKTLVEQLEEQLNSGKVSAEDKDKMRQLLKEAKELTQPNPETQTSSNPGRYEQYRSN